MPVPPEPDAPSVLIKIGDMLGYAWMLLLAIWGGTASYISRIRKTKSPFSVIELIGEWTISGFAGVVTALVCYRFQFDFYATSAAVGIAGHMGGRAIGMLEHYWVQRARLLCRNDSSSGGGDGHGD